MKTISALARLRQGTKLHRRLATLVLVIWVTAPEAWGQSEPDEPDAPPAAGTTRRPRLLKRWLADKNEPDPQPQPEARDLAPDGPPAGLPPLPKAGADAAPVDSAVVRTQGGAIQNQSSYLNQGDVSIGSEADLSFARRLFNSYRDEPTGPEPENPAAPPSRRGLPAPFQAPPMPFADFIGPTVGVNDTSVFPIMDALYKGPNGQFWKDSRLKIFGWADPSYNASTSRRSNIPLAYSIVPNSLQMSQVIVAVERTIDTVQTEKFQFGFKFYNLYGIDYRYTLAKGYFSDQLLKHNHLYGYDPIQLFMDFYAPKLFQGTVFRIGRFISPLDIEAQFSPDNFLYTHSLMYTYDPYTFSGGQMISRVSDRFWFQLGVHAGNDMAVWTTSSQVNGEILLKWISPNNKDSLFGGLDSIGHGYYKNQHDDLQVFGLTWSHKFNDKFTTMTEQYYIWQRQALQGGTVTNGPPESFNLGVGPGKLLPGLSSSYGIVNYTSYILNDKALLVLRSDCLADFNGQRTGVAGAYFEHTLGYVRHLTSWAILRPEVRFDYTSGQKGYDNGTKREQFTFNIDLIIRF